MRKVDIKLINKKLDKIREVVKDVFPTMDWFDKYENNYFMWRPNMTGEDLVMHFEKKLKKYLD